MVFLAVYYVVVQWIVIFALCGLFFEAYVVFIPFLAVLKENVRSGSLKDCQITIQNSEIRWSRQISMPYCVNDDRRAV